jgi:hypothetical protein
MALEDVRHRCLIYYGAPTQQLPHVAATIVENLKAGRRCLYLNSPALVDGMRSNLATKGVDVAGEVYRGSLVLSSSQDHLTDGVFNPALMLSQLRHMAQQARKDGYTGLWASGDMTWEFGDESNLDKLVEYERGLEEVFHEFPDFAGVCQYHVSSLPPHSVKQGLITHRGVYLNEMLERMNPYYVAPNSGSGNTVPSGSVEEIVKHLAAGAA